jgi:glycogen debranching enzyme
MDTVDENYYPLDIQVQFLNFVSSISILGDLINKKREISEFLDFEILLKAKIINTYFKNGYLYNDIENKTFNINVFLSYYFFPDLLFKEDWEKVFDKAILKMFDSGLFSSLSKFDKRFKSVHTGEDNLSYHMGDSWYFMNNLAAICLFDLNEKKYRKEILKIIKTSTNDILRFGCIGFASEISSASKQESVGCFAQCWSSASFVEMINKIFDKN